MQSLLSSYKIYYENLESDPDFKEIRKALKEYGKSLDLKRKLKKGKANETTQDDIN